MRVLVTGAGGYIGSILTPMLMEKGHETVVLDRFFFGQDKLPANRNGLVVLEDDIRFAEKKAFKGVEAVIDLAALSNDPSGELDPIKTWSINYLGRLRMAALAKANGVKRYILPSSCSVYGFQDQIIDENSSVNPLTTYAKANYKAECDIKEFADGNFTVVILRQSTVYGYSPRMRFDLAINGMVRGFFLDGKIPIMKDGSQWRPMVHVTDTSAAIIKALEAPADIVNKQIFNVGSSDQNYQIFDLAKRIAGAINIPFNYEWYGTPDNRSYRVNFDKIGKVLGFRAEYNAEKGAGEVWAALKDKRLDPDDPMTITVKWYKKLLADGVMI